jgi:UDP-N-acetylmuramyl tripeptide synthase
MPSLLGAKLAVARGAGTLAKLGGSGATSLPGRVLMALEPQAIGTLGARLPRGSAVISATNGKTTTAAMAAGILAEAGIPLVHNQAGANMAGGVATTLLDAARGREIAGEMGLFEVDELWLASVTAALAPRAIVLGNLFRDQLDRFGELDAIADSWAQLLETSPTRAVLNADDPLLADLGRERDPAARVYFGVEDDTLALPGLGHAADAKHCRRCGSPYVFDAVYLGHLGHYHCPTCGATRPTPQVLASEVALQGVRSAAFTLTTPAGAARVELALPGLYNVYNALAAAALGVALELPLDAVVAGLEAARPAFGRAETLRLGMPGAANGHGEDGGRELRILLVKNPAGANEVLRTLALEPGEHDLLGVLNDQIADGRDVSWIWDADFELLADRIASAVCSGSRAADLAARLKYAGMDPARITIEPDLPRALDTAAERTARGGTLYALPTYTAMLALRELLVARGAARGRWS